MAVFEPSDEVLVSGCLNQDATSWKSLVLRYRNLIYQIALAHFTTDVEATDIFLDVCTELSLHLEAIRDVRSLEPWLIAVTLRKCKQVLHYRPHSRRFEDTDSAVLSRHIASKIETFRADPALAGQDLEINDDVLARAFRLFQRLRRRPTASVDIVDSVASLVFDSRTNAGVVGIRGASDPRQLSLTAGEFDLHLGVAHDRDSTSVRGQLLARGQSGFVSPFCVLLVGDNRDTLDAAIANEFGEFTFERKSFAGATFSIRLKEGAAVKAIAFQLPT